MDSRQEIAEWMRSGCDTDMGVALYIRYGDNHLFKHLLTTDPNSYSYKLPLLLAKIVGVKPTSHTQATRTIERDRFRQIYPFLAERDCPLELKALAADKISTYWQCVDLHEHLFFCHTNKECCDTAGKLVATFIEDRLIKSELEYYRNHRGVLGKHHIFAEQRHIADIRKLSIRQLIHKEKQLRDNIWRIQSELKKDNKPHLLHERHRRLEEKQRELNLVISLQIE